MISPRLEMMRRRMREQVRKNCQLAFGEVFSLLMNFTKFKPTGELA